MKKNNSDSYLFSQSYLSKMQKHKMKNEKKLQETIIFKVKFNKSDYLILPKFVQKFLKGHKVSTGDEIELTFFDQS